MDISLLTIYQVSKTILSSHLTCQYSWNQNTIVEEDGSKVICGPQPELFGKEYFSVSRLELSIVIKEKFVK